MLFMPKCTHHQQRWNEAAVQYCLQAKHGRGFLLYDCCMSSLIKCCQYLSWGLFTIIMQHSGNKTVRNCVHFFKSSHSDHDVPVLKCRCVPVLCPQLSPSPWATALRWRKCLTVKGNLAWISWRPISPRKVVWRRPWRSESSMREQLSCVRRKLY